MSYQRRVVKRRPASLTEEEWCTLLATRFVDRGYFRDRDGWSPPPPDIAGLVMQAKLTDLRWRCEVLWVSLLKPAVNGASHGVSSATVAQGKLLADYSNIWEFLTSTSWSDGTSRIPGSLSLKLTSGSLQVTLTDPSTATYCCRSALVLEDALTALEMAFLDGTLGWRRSSYAKPKK